MIDLAPCLECKRHVRPGDACPFCGSARGTGALVRGRYRGLTRAAIFVAGAAIAGCGGADDPPPEEETIMQPYGAPPNPPPETIMQPYGAPPNPEPDPVPPPEPPGPEVPEE
jgi:hypothetical protein